MTPTTVNGIRCKACGEGFERFERFEAHDCSQEAPNDE